MVFQRRRPRKDRLDQLDGFVVTHAALVDDPPDPNCIILPAPKWSPPEGAMTLASVGIERARDACRSRTHVIIREDPMFGRRGYAKEVIPDATHGFLVLVVAFCAREDRFLGWKEPFKPRAEERMYWRLDKVEFA